jgi:hypothetical protein
MVERLNELRKLLKKGGEEGKSAFKEFIDLQKKMDEERLRTMSDEEFNTLNRMRVRHGKEPWTR